MIDVHEPAASAAGPRAPGPRRRSDAWSLSWHGIRTVAQLELRQRVRSTRWIVSLVVFAVIVGGVTALTWAASRGLDPSGTLGSAMFGFIVFFVLFLGLLVSPTLSSTSINGDRAAGTLATLQVTLLTPAEIVLGKLLAAWVASLAFLAVSVPFILWAFANGGTPLIAVVTTLVLLALLLAVVCAIGLGFSALTARTAGSAVLTYVTVASLTVVSLIVFGLTMPLVSGEETVRVYQPDWANRQSDGTQPECVWTEEVHNVTHTERTWWLLAANPFVIVADAAPSGSADPRYGSADPLSGIRAAVRTARLGPPATRDWCTEMLYGNYADGGGGEQDARELSPVWPWGLGLNLLLGAGGIVLAVRRLSIPLAKLPRGTRVA